MIKSRIAFLALLALMLALVACGGGGDGPKLPEGVLFQDDFSADQGAWILEADLDANASLKDGQLQISIDAPNLIAWAEVKEKEFADFALEVDASQLGGPDNNSYGIVFRKRSPSAYYRFDISGDGYYALTRRDETDGGTWTWITPDWLASDAIHQGASSNHVKIVAQGSHLVFYVNDQLLLETDDNGYRSGGVGLDAGSFNEAGVLIGFDNLVIREP